MKFGTFFKSKRRKRKTVNKEHDIKVKSYIVLPIFYNLPILQRRKMERLNEIMCGKEVHLQYFQHGDKVFGKYMQKGIYFSTPLQKNP